MSIRHFHLWNIIAARKEDFKLIVKEYQTDATKEALDRQYGGQTIPVW
ncbi:MetQ/NlpA family ABC transporter substrate-binding protein [Peptoanaerobacter stomatis]